MTSTHDNSQDVSLRLAQRLVRQGRLDQPLAKTALAHSRQRQIRLEDALVDCGVSEHILLRHLADLYRTQLVSTEKLEHAKVTPRVLRMVPKSVAQRHIVVPIVLTATGELVVATPDPESVDLVKDVQLASQVREVRTTVARPAAVLAAIRKFYDGDQHAFNSLSDAAPVTEGMALELTNNQGRSSLTTAAVSEPPPPPRPEPPDPSLRPRRTRSAPRAPAISLEPPEPSRPSAALIAPAPTPTTSSAASKATAPGGDMLHMAPPTAAGAARSGSDPNFQSFDFSAGLSMPAPAAATTASAQPAPVTQHRESKRPQRSGGEFELDLAITDDERARLPESGRGRRFEQREFQPPPSPPQSSLPPLLGGFGEDPSEESAAQGESLAPMSSTPPAIGLFDSGPPSAPARTANPLQAVAESADSLPPLLGLVPSIAPAAASVGSAAQSTTSPFGFSDSSASYALSLSPGSYSPGQAAQPPPSPTAPGVAPRVPLAGAIASAPAGAALPQSMQQWISLLDSTPPAGGGTGPAPTSTTPHTSSPLSIPPAPASLDAHVPYSLSQGLGVLQAPLLFARSMVALHERAHGELAAHSIVVEELSRVIAAQLGASRDEQEQVEIAALLHDLGKSRSRHLTVYSVWHYHEYEQIAREQYLLPLQLFSSAGLSAGVMAAITHLYERVDGKGFPNGLSGNSVPLLSRLLAVCDSFVDLILNSNNPFGRTLSDRDALLALQEKSGSLFDPTLLAQLAAVIVDAGVDLRLRQRQVTI
ncbi:MAG TPA: HD domain-containing phosphohydrolase [Polyangiaceae bacterium]|nr:HD domain-containing phosphohydrolase [Polyangiaceae bacterium]